MPTSESVSVPVCSVLSVGVPVSVGTSVLSVVLSVISLCITAILQTMISAFHSKFVCTLGQLFKNSGLMILAHPLRSILMAALVWSPILLFLGDLRIFILITPLFITLYFSFTHLLANSLMRKPFDSLVKLMQERQKEAEVTE